MPTLCYFPFLVLLLAGVGQQAKKDDGKDDRKKLQGEWAVVSWESKRRGMTKEQAKQSKLVVSGDEWQPTVRGIKAVKMKVKLNPTKTPKEADFTLLEKLAGVDDFTMKGIYKLDGDKLTICRTVRPDIERPKEFMIEEWTVLIVFKRAAKAKK